MRTFRRALVLGNEAARHPFRQSLPPHVTAALPDDQGPARGWRQRLTAGDVRDFLTAYCAAFLAVSAFIS